MTAASGVGLAARTAAGIQPVAKMSAGVTTLTCIEMVLSMLPPSGAQATRYTGITPETRQRGRAFWSRKRLIQGLLLVMSTAAFGGDSLSVAINNDSGESLLVTIRDLNTNPVVHVMLDQTVNGFSSVSITITANDTGQGHLSWNVTTVGNDMRMCGHQEVGNVNDGDAVNVYADSECRT